MRDAAAPSVDGVHETVRRAVDLSLREGPELDGLQPGSPRRRGRAGQEIAARPRIPVDLGSMARQQVGDSLDLVDDHQVRERHESLGVGGGRLPVDHGCRGRANLVVLSLATTRTNVLSPD